MSGPMSPAVAEAARTYALQAEAAAKGLTIGRLIGTRQREKLAERQRKAETVGGAIWRGYSEQVRVLLVMHAAQDYSGDPRMAAMQPWKSFSDRDQAQIGAMARELGREFKDAEYLR